MDRPQQSHAEKEQIIIKTCPTCGLELVGERALCACTPNLQIEPPPDPMIGQTLSCYKIVEVIGRGGMGVIYKAHDQWMDRFIAIKMLHRHLVHDPQSLERFKQEAKAAGNIEHPNVIQAYDYGVMPETEQPYIVLEYLQGKSISDVIDQEKRIEPERAVNIFIQASDALVAAHAKNVLHRDLKPSNIMLVKTRDQEDVVKIVDFGIAKLLPTDPDEAQMTQTGEVFGSPLYMSPEQFQGHKLDVRSDIYSLGCVMYESLTGTPPVSGEHVLETMVLHLKQIPKSFKEVSPGLKISGRIEEVVQRSLEKKPENRYQSMAELRDALMLTRSGFKDKRPFSVKVQAKMAQLKRLRRRYEQLASNALLMVLSGIIAASLVGFAFLYLKTNQETHWRDLKAQAQNAYRKEDFPVAERKLTQAAKVALENFGEDDPRFIDTLKRLAWVHNAQGQYAKGRKLFEKVYRLSGEELARIRNAQMALASDSLVDMMMKSNSTVGPEELLRRASETLEKYLGSNDPELIPLLEKLAVVYQKQGRYADAETQYWRIFSIMKETEGDESVGAAFAHKLLGGLFQEWSKVTKDTDAAESKKQWDMAQDNYKESLRLYKSIIGPTCPEAKEVQELIDGVRQPENVPLKPVPNQDTTIPPLS